MKEVLKSAIDSLSIFHIYIRESQTKMADGYNSLNINDLKKSTQSYRLVKKIEAIEQVSEHESTPSRLFYSFHYEVGTRLVERKSKEEDSVQDEGEQNYLTIEACFEAIYAAKKELSIEEIEAFAAQNVGFNVWPYWREFVQSSCTRMGLNPIKIPFYKVNRSDIPAAIERK